MAEISIPDVWSLHARPESLVGAESGWRTLERAARRAADDVSSRARAVYRDTWAGAAAESFAAHNRKLVADLDDTADLAGAAAGALARAAGALRAAQSHLTDEWTKVVAVRFTYDAPMHLVFSPEDDAQARIVNDSIGRCRQVRAGLDEKLTDDMMSLDKVRTDLRALAARWQAVASGQTYPLVMPPEFAGTGVIVDGDRVVINTGNSDDVIDISVNPRTGHQVVTVNGQQRYFPPGADIVVRAGGGDDTITVAPGTKVSVTLLGGGGNDTITGADGDETILGLDGRDRLYGMGGEDRVSAGAGRDHVDGGSGDDILAGGEGDDTVRGLGGDDDIDGGEGRDYLEGATGDDTTSGGAGNDIISGGRGDDTSRGGAGDDTIYAGRGTDISDGGQGVDKVFGERGDTAIEVDHQVTVEIKDLATFIKVEGSPEFKERVEADLEMLRSSPRGQQMLAALQQGHEESEGGWWLWHRDGESLTIKEYDNPKDPNNATANSRGTDNTIAYNTHLDRLKMSGSGGYVQGPPVAILYHEMAHVYDYMNDTQAPGDYQGADNPGVPNRERQAVGLPIDEDDDPSTPTTLYSKHPYALTENALREEMGAPRRDAY